MRRVTIDPRFALMIQALAEIALERGDDPAAWTQAERP